MVHEGISDPGIIRVQLRNFVKSLGDEIPHPSNNRFYPSDATIRNHIYKAKDSRLIDDQANIYKWVCFLCYLWLKLVSVNNLVNMQIDLVNVHLM